MFEYFIELYSREKKKYKKNPKVYEDETAQCVRNYPLTELNDPEDRVNYWMGYAIKTLAIAQRKITPTDPLVIGGRDLHMGKYLWTSYMLLGKALPEKFDQKSIGFNIVGFDPTVELGSTWLLSYASAHKMGLTEYLDVDWGFAPESLYEMEFKKYLNVDLIQYYLFYSIDGAKRNSETKKKPPLHAPAATAPRPAIATAPRTATISAPRPTVATAPRAAAVSTPRPAVATAPRAAAVSTPRPAVATAPRAAAVSTPRPAVATAPRAAAVSTPRPTVATAPRNAAVSTPRPTVATAPRTATVPVPRPAVASAPRTATVPAPRPTEASAPRTATISAPRPAVATAPVHSPVPAARPLASAPTSTSIFSLYWQVAPSISKPDAIYIAGINGDWSLREEWKLHLMNNNIYCLKRPIPLGKHFFKYVEKYAGRPVWLPEGKENILKIVVSSEGVTVMAYRGSEVSEIGVAQLTEDDVETVLLVKKPATDCAFYCADRNKTFDAQRLFHRLSAGDDQHWYPQILLNCKKATPSELTVVAAIEHDGVANHWPRALMKAIKFGEQSSAFYLGQSYETGHEGVKKDLTLAFHSYLQAAKLGDHEALTPLDRLGDTVSAENQRSLSQWYGSFFNHTERAAYWRTKAMEVEQFTF